MCTLIYYPEEKLELIKAAEEEEDLDDWYHITIHRLVAVCRDVSSKYTRSKVRKSLPEEFAYIIEELLHERTDDSDKAAYVSVIVDTIISTGRADDFIIALCNVIQRLAIDQLHILGDIYDRGPGAHIILDTLKQYHSWDIQWGNHDMLWMGAGAGNNACICNVLRLSLRYANLTTVEEAYGINLVPLATFAMEVYGDDPCEEFIPKLMPGNTMQDKYIRLTAQMHKAISIIQFKKEAQIFKRRPEWGMLDRCLLDHCNQNLLFHASVPLNADGSLKEVELYNGQRYSGKKLMHHIGMLVRAAFESDTEKELRLYARDYFLYLWCGKDSPLFDKSKMATFERYFLTDKAMFKEEKGNYFRLRDSEEVVDRILDAFGVQGENRHIINGHVPVHASKGENPIKANGKLMVIDGGFSQAYHSETGIAGYTLVYHSRGFQLVQHEPFTSASEAIEKGTDIKSTTQLVELSAHRMLVADTDKGVELRSQIADLRQLLYAYRHGIITEAK